MIPYGRQDIDAADIDAVVAVLRSDFLTQGPAIDRFEARVAEYCAVPHAIAMSSATAALHVACLALDLGPGDRLWTVPNTFVASANCGRYCGATIDFVDIDATTFNMDIGALRAKLKDARLTGNLPKVVVPVHFSGQSCDMREIAELGREYGFRIIEDASHAVGGDYAGERIGGGRWSDITVFSFHPVKIVTTAEGGLATTRDPELAVRLRELRTHGITRDPTRMTLPVDGPWYYEQNELGYNYRMTDVHAALGLSQMRRIDEFVTRRHAIADRYDVELAGLPLQLPVRLEGRRSALHLYVVRVQYPSLSRREVFEALRARGIGVNVHYIPVHLQPYYRALGFGPGSFPVSEQYYAEAISLPIYSAMTNEQQSEVVATLTAVLGKRPC